MIRTRAFFITVAGAGAIEAGVVPVAEVAVTPDRDAGGGAGAGGVGDGAGEGAVVEGFPLGTGKDGALREGGDFVVAGFVVVVAEERGLYGVFSRG